MIPLSLLFTKETRMRKLAIALRLLLTVKTILRSSHGIQPINEQQLAPLTRGVGGFDFIKFEQ